MPSYHPQRIEPKWQAYWERNKTFRTADFEPGKPKYYVLDMFPYPSGEGLHVGHPEGYTATDILCRSIRRPFCGCEQRAYVRNSCDSIIVTLWNYLIGYKLAACHKANADRKRVNRS